MIDLTAFKNQIIKYEIAMAIVIEFISLFPLGWNVNFAGGLAVGTAVSIINFNIIVYTGEKVSDEKRGAPAVLGYILRMPIYGIVFFLCIHNSLTAAIGCVFGFITLQVAIFYVYGIRSHFKGARKNPLNDTDEPREWNVIEDDDWDDEDWGIKKKLPASERNVSDEKEDARPFDKQ